MANGITGILDPESSAIQQEIAEVQNQINQIQYGGQIQGGLLGGGQGGTQSIYSKSALPPEQIQQVYGLLAAYGDDPQKAGSDYVRAMQTQAQLRSTYGRAPSSVREWEYYNSLSPEDQRRYLEMKRGIQIEEIAGQMVRPFGTPGMEGAGPGGMDVYSTLAQESQAAGARSASQSLGTAAAQRYAVLSEGQNERYENYSQAMRLRQLVSQQELATGQYTGLVYRILPQADQEALDALSERVARARLKLTDPRPTDADVEGMKRALFGSNRTEEFTVDSLDALIREIEWLEAEYKRVGDWLGSVGAEGWDMGVRPWAPGAMPGGQGQVPGATAPPTTTPGGMTPEQQAEWNQTVDQATPAQLLQEIRRRQAQGQ